MKEIKYCMDINSIKNKSCFSKLPDGRIVFFGQGKRDDFCTYVAVPVWNNVTNRYDTMCGSVTDDFYFGICKELADAYGTDVVYWDHLVGIYNMVTDRFDGGVVRSVLSVVGRFDDDAFRAEAALAYLLIYYGMVAEENYGVGTSHMKPVCGKVIKMAGLYKHLVEGVPLGNPQNPGACHCYVGVNPNVILQDAAKYGIHRDFVVHRLS